MNDQCFCPFFVCGVSQCQPTDPALSLDSPSTPNARLQCEMKPLYYIFLTRTKPYPRIRPSLSPSVSVGSLLTRLDGRWTVNSYPYLTSHWTAVPVRRAVRSPRLAQCLLAMVVLMLQVCWLQYEVDPKHGSDCAIVIACPRLQAKGEKLTEKGKT